MTMWVCDGCRYVYPLGTPTHKLQPCVKCGHGSIRNADVAGDVARAIAAENKHIYTLHMLYTLDLDVGMIGSTVRLGPKWRDQVALLELINICVCLPTRHDHNVVGVGEVVDLWYGRFTDIPAKLLVNEHEERSRTYWGLCDSMKMAYGDQFTEQSDVTVLSYRLLSKDGIITKDGKAVVMQGGKVIGAQG